MKKIVMLLACVVGLAACNVEHYEDCMDEDELALRRPGRTDHAAHRSLAMETPSYAPPAIEASGPQAIESTNTLDQQLGEMMGDAPMCDTCGHITIRNGSCYKCLNCGSTSGCS